MLRGEHATLDELPNKLKKSPLKIKKKLNLNIPFFFPNFALNPLSIKIFNWIYYNKQGKKQNQSTDFEIDLNENSVYKKE